MRFMVIAAAGLLLHGFLHAEDLTLSLSSQRGQVGGQWEHIAWPERWAGEQTAVIVCDVWDYHHCLSAVRRMEEFVPRLNQVLGEARRRGATIIHAPSDCMDAYAEHPARRRARDLPLVNPLPPGIRDWCLRIASEEQATYPIDQSDGGEDDDPREHAEWSAKLKSLGRNPAMPWKAQSPLITIDDQRDYISDRGDEVWSILHQRGIRHVILAGVHANMCVLGRPFGLRQMARQGMPVVLMRDMTDSMYNPRRWPHVDHFTGHDMVLAHIERYVCPTITSDQLLGGEPFRWKTDKRSPAEIAAVWQNSPRAAAAPEKDWAAISIGNGKDYKTNLEGPAWYRCVLHLPKPWIDAGGLVVEVPGIQSAQVWLNGQPLAAASAAGRAFPIEPQSINADDANLLVLRVEHRRGEAGLREAPVIANARARTPLNGRWQFRLGDDSRWANMPLPAKFGGSTEMVFYIDPPTYPRAISPTGARP